MPSKSNPTAVNAATTPQRTFTPEELARYDNENPSQPVYVAIKGIVFDVSANRDMYPHQSGYGLFAGKDASRALAKSSLSPEDIRPDWQDLDEEKIKVLDHWVSFYQNKYKVVGKVVHEAKK